MMGANEWNALRPGCIVTDIEGRKWKVILTSELDAPSVDGHSQRCAFELLSPVRSVLHWGVFVGTEVRH